MPLRNKSTTDIYTDTEISFQPATTITFQINNNPARVQINVPLDQQGGFRGENWVDKGTVQPGIWTLSAQDFQQVGGNKCTGVRFISDISGNPAIINVNN